MFNELIWKTKLLKHINMQNLRTQRNFSFWSLVVACLSKTFRFSSSCWLSFRLVHTLLISSCILLITPIGGASYILSVFWAFSRNASSISDYLGALKSPSCFSLISQVSFLNIGPRSSYPRSILFSILIMGDAWSSSSGKIIAFYTES